ncbi:MAG TPA: NAD(+) diphosphatase [Bacteroidaceae bacterium]|nr:NAD(+) diphosphatase [Bacteroidaceae bacterium]
MMILDVNKYSEFKTMREAEKKIEAHRPLNEDIVSNDYWIILHGELLLLKEDTNDDFTTYSLPQGKQPPIKVTNSIIHPITLPLESTPIAQSIEMDTAPHIEGYIWVGMRDAYDVLANKLYTAVGKAHQMHYWALTHRYCGKCGTPTIQASPNMMKCPACHEEYFPRISPAMIVRITRGKDEIFLVQSRGFRKAFKGLVAGFMEVGESLEETVLREVREETGLEIKNINYFGSQPWPYPSGLMLGFTAEYAGGEVHLQEEELISGQFYHRDNLPAIPKKLSLARLLIDDWLENTETT